MSIPAPAAVVDFDEALAVVTRQARAVAAGRAQQAPGVSVETLALLAARGRTLAHPVFADRDQPPFNRSTRDGFAVRAADLAHDQPLAVTGQLRAGERPADTLLAPGSAIEIMTGAPLPPGADAVLMVEHVVAEAGKIRLANGRTLGAGENVAARGAEAHVGETVLPEGIVVGAREIAAAASCGYASLPVFGRARVAILATGDELVELEGELEDFQIRNSNSYALAALVEAAGGEPVRLPIVPDRREAILAAIAQARRSADLLLLSGGVSMGKYDLVEEALGELRADFFFTGVRMQPGKPVVFGRLPAQAAEPPIFFFGLPGNPLSVQVTFGCFVEPLLRALSGGAGEEGPGWTGAVLGAGVNRKPGLTRLLPCSIRSVEGRVEAQLVPWQGSGDLTAGARANGFVELRADRAYRAGDPVRVLGRSIGPEPYHQTMSELTHFDAAGEARMVDVSGKAETRRAATAGAFVELSAAVLAALPTNPKGDPLAIARFAGIQAAKRTASLIPLCHPIPISFVDVALTVETDGIRIEATAATTAGTGVEMEAMVAASVAALTVYDMTKALDKGIRIREIALERKSGGKSGEWRRA